MLMMAVMCPHPMWSSALRGVTFMFGKWLKRLASSSTDKGNSLLNFSTVLPCTALFLLSESGIRHIFQAWGLLEQL